MKTQLTEFAILAILGLTSAFTIGCDGGRTKRQSQPNVELIQDMMEQPALKAQDEEPYEKGKAASRLPPAGTVPVGYTPYKYKGDPVAAAANLKNPLAGQLTPEILSVGQKKYDTYCIVCHGRQGEGDGPVAAKMALKPPTLISEKLVRATDGAIYHIITDGQGVMSSYAYQLVDERDRWAIVNYVRSLQKLKGTK